MRPRTVRGPKPRLVKESVSVLPLATTPRAVGALPSSTSCAPTMVSQSPTSPSISGSRMRSSARANVRAVTGFPSENRASLRIVNVYVRPFRDTTGSDSARLGSRR
jgi:hypothetical protein